MPTRVLRPHAQLGAAHRVGDGAAGNLLVQGDKLDALTGLPPQNRLSRPWLRRDGHRAVLHGQDDDGVRRREVGAEETVKAVA